MDSAEKEKLSRCMSNGNLPKMALPIKIFMCVLLNQETDDINKVKICIYVLRLEGIICACIATMDVILVVV